MLFSTINAKFGQAMDLCSLHTQKVDPATSKKFAADENLLAVALGIGMTARKILNPLTDENSIYVNTFNEDLLISPTTKKNLTKLTDKQIRNTLPKMLFNTSIPATSVFADSNLLDLNRFFLFDIFTKIQEAIKSSYDRRKIYETVIVDYIENQFGLNPKHLAFVVASVLLSRSLFFLQLPALQQSSWDIVIISKFPKLGQIFTPTTKADKKKSVKIKTKSNIVQYYEYNESSLGVIKILKIDLLKLINRKQPIIRDVNDYKKLKSYLDQKCVTSNDRIDLSRIDDAPHTQFYQGMQCYTRIFFRYNPDRQERIQSLHEFFSSAFPLLFRHIDRHLLETMLDLYLTKTTQEIIDQCKLGWGTVDHLKVDLIKLGIIPTRKWKARVVSKAPKSQCKWSLDEITTLIENWNKGKTCAKIANILGRSAHGVYDKIKELRQKSPHLIKRRIGRGKSKEEEKGN